MHLPLKPASPPPLPPLLCSVCYAHHCIVSPVFSYLCTNILKAGSQYLTWSATSFSLNRASKATVKDSGVMQRRCNWWALRNWAAIYDLYSRKCLVDLAGEDSARAPTRLFYLSEILFMLCINPTIVPLPPSSVSSSTLPSFEIH